jgi:hypothetical protein
MLCVLGYPGTEMAVRAAVTEVLGEAKADYFFDKVGSPALQLV